MGLPFASDYVIRTYTVGYAGGRATESGPTSQTIKAVVTPLTDRELQRLAEGGRIGGRFKVRTQTDLGDLGDRAEAASRRIVVDGREYQLDAWGRWDQGIFGSLNHQKYLAMEIRT